MMLEEDLLKTRKCVTPKGPATATKSFSELFFRTCGTKAAEPLRSDPPSPHRSGVGGV